MSQPVDAAPPKAPDEIENEVDRVEKERNEAQEGWYRLRQEVNLPGGLRDRLAAAESSLERMRERVAGLADKWERFSRSLLCLSGPESDRIYQCALELRSTLRSPSTPETKDDHR